LIDVPIAHGKHGFMIVRQILKVLSLHL